MPTLTPAERRGALLLVALIAIGTVNDLVRAIRPEPAAPLESATAVPGPGAAPAPVDSPAARAGGPLDLNRAGERELDALPGIGPVLARRIVEHRLAHGGFREPADLLAVRGIGPRLYARLEPLVTVRGERKPAAAPGAAAGP